MLRIPFEEQDKLGLVKFKHSFTIIESSARYNITNKKSNFYVGLGASFFTGKEVYISAVSNDPSYLDKDLNLTDRQATYYGANCLIGYNKFIFKNRMNIGFSTKFRILTQNVKSADINLNFGYNFNILKKHTGVN